MSATAHVFRLPDLGEGLTEAEIVAWHVAVGDEVGVDQEVVTVETAKAAVDVPCPFAGAVAELHAQPGTVLTVGSPLITISAGDGAGEPGRDAAGEQYRTEERAGSAERPLIGYGAGEAPARRRAGRRRASPTPPPSPPDAPSGSSQTPPNASSGSSQTPPNASSGSSGRAIRVISPLVRALAREWDIDLESVSPGPTGVIRKADLVAARATQPLGASGGDQTQTLGASGEVTETRVPIQGVTRIMVDRLTTSRREIPDATTWVDVDATGLMEVKEALRAARPELGIGVLPLMARIVVAGLHAYPALNASVDLAAGEIVRHGAVHLGFAAQSPRGLVVPVVHEASEMTTAELAAALRELTGKAREGSLTPAQLTGGTFTLNNYGVYGVDGSTPIINHPEAGMLGVGRIVDKPWVHEGQLAVRKVTQLGFTFDHRVCDGGTAGGFLRFVADCVEQPSVLLAEL
ncbi:dihydrolipoamide acetyltransferase family protein [Ornithinimicrobium tianjinense]|uniref:Dihydrolipoamide acetyltransferase component of pyruvate dehydrogenase complex n=1 Tax=Ornithinimicrobium tianjinense TaxID=1195761 RepID=A0A917F8Q8_9MICO|nr:dihydrolipoamide acetyltransferase family protein [Ornithinimicrobium tianjinense]GGF58285.1 dihydrolipoamide acetyltransferase component of pyruvate dehydrogenase complex [Ornithinimicrobium tianjinense]